MSKKNKLQYPLTEKEKLALKEILKTLEAENEPSEISTTSTVYYDDILYSSSRLLNSFGERSIRGIISTLKRKGVIDTYVTRDQDDSNTISLKIAYDEAKELL